MATHALSIFGDHSDVMAVRQTGCAPLCASNVQEAQDFALIAQVASLNSRLPFIHFFDGFRTSHEIAKIVPLDDDTLRALLPAEAIRAHRAGADPDKPVIRGTAANPDTYFQCREATNPWYDDGYRHVSEAMNAFAERTGRHYRPFEYVGHPEAERVLVLMGSAIGTCEEVITRLIEQGEKVGLVKVRLYRPFSAAHLLAVIPESARKVGCAGSHQGAGRPGQPLYLDVVSALAEAVSRGSRQPTAGHRRTLRPLLQEFNPACVQAIFDELALDNPRPRFTVGIFDDVTGLSLPLPALDYSSPGLGNQHKLEALFTALAATAQSAAKNSIKILGNHTDLYPQGYFVYDSKKAGGLTVSHLRVGERPLQSAYLVDEADFIGCHQWQFIDMYQMTERLRPDGIFLLNSPYDAAQIWQRLPQEVQQALLQKRARLYTINAAKIARECQLGNRINTVMQMAFFQLTAIIPPAEATELLRRPSHRAMATRSKRWWSATGRPWLLPARPSCRCRCRHLTPPATSARPWYRPRPRLRADRHRRHAGGAG